MNSAISLRIGPRPCLIMTARMVLPGISICYENLGDTYMKMGISYATLLRYLPTPSPVLTWAMLLPGEIRQAIFSYDRCLPIKVETWDKVRSYALHTRSPVPRYSCTPNGALVRTGYCSCTRFRRVVLTAGMVLPGGRGGVPRQPRARALLSRRAPVLPTPSTLPAPVLAYGNSSGTACYRPTPSTLPLPIDVWLYARCSDRACCMMCIQYRRAAVW